MTHLKYITLIMKKQISMYKYIRTNTNTDSDSSLYFNLTTAYVITTYVITITVVLNKYN